MNNNQSKSIVVIGSTNTDMVINTPHLPRPGETVLGGTFKVNPGGKGANQAVAVRRMGGDLTFITKVGDDMFGRQAIENFRADGINTDFVSVTPDYPSGVASIYVDAKGENCIAVASGANEALSCKDIDAAAEVIAKAEIMLLQLETSIETVTYAAKMAKRNGVTVVLNPAPARILPEELLRNVDIIIPNRTEMETITGVPEGTDPEYAVGLLGQYGVDTVVVTLGSAGALVCVGGECTHVPSFKVKAVDTTAAGDTFCGAFCVGLAEGLPVEKAVLLGNLTASIAVQRPGAQPSIPTRAEVDAEAVARGLKKC